MLDNADVNFVESQRTNEAGKDLFQKCVRYVPWLKQPTLHFIAFYITPMSALSNTLMIIIPKINFDLVDKARIWGLTVNASHNNSETATIAFGLSERSQDFGKCKQLDRG